MPLERYAHRPPADVERVVRRAAVRWAVGSLGGWLAERLARVMRGLAQARQKQRARRRARLDA